MNKIFNDITGYEGIYQVSCEGTVRSMDRIITAPLNDIIRTHSVIGKEMKQSLSKDGYPRVGLTKHNKHVKIKVHRLVASAFVPNPHNYTEVNHIDGDKKNNNFTNLEWCDRSHNIKHAFDTELRTHRGVKHPGSTLTEQDVIHIRTCGLSNGELSMMYSVSTSHIWAIRKRLAWKHI
jgi:hypothetical protein